MHSNDRRKNQVSLTARGNGIQFTLPKAWFEKGTPQIRFMLGLLNTEDGWEDAERIARDIEHDFSRGRLPETVEGIKRKYQPKSHLTVLEAITPKSQVSLKELCEQFFEYKSHTASAKTIHTVYNRAIANVAKCPTDGFTDPLKFRMELMQVTTKDSVRRTLMQVSAACKWGMKHKLCSENPFDGMYKEFEISKAPPPVAFTVEERDRIIQAFRDHKGNWNGKSFVGIKYSPYAPFVKFLFFTGCRPSEAVGLRWRHVRTDFSKVQFCEPIVEINGKLIQNEKDKTKAERWFPCPQKVQDLLQSIKPENPDSESLVFPAPKGGAINISNFGDDDRAWGTILSSLNLQFKEVENWHEPIKMTPYSCRDTFITLQAQKGVSTDVIARWVGNSASVIEKKYLDKGKLDHLRPEDI